MPGEVRTAAAGNCQPLPTEIRDERQEQVRPEDPAPGCGEAWRRPRHFVRDPWTGLTGRPEGVVKPRDKEKSVPLGV